MTWRLNYELRQTGIQAVHSPLDVPVTSSGMCQCRFRLWSTAFEYSPSGSPFFRP